jgi:hypothetical protein
VTLISLSDHTRLIGQGAGGDLFLQHYTQALGRQKSARGDPETTIVISGFVRLSRLPGYGQVAHGNEGRQQGTETRSTNPKTQA